MPIASPDVETSEVPWDAYPEPDAPFTENSPKILWVLQHSYPVLSVEEIEAALSLDPTSVSGDGTVRLHAEANLSTGRLFVGSTEEIADAERDPVRDAE